MRTRPQRAQRPWPTPLPGHCGEQCRALGARAHRQSGLTQPGASNFGGHVEKLLPHYILLGDWAHLLRSILQPPEGPRASGESQAFTSHWLNTVPQIHIQLEPRKGTLSGSRPFADVVMLRPYWTVTMTSKERQRDAHRRPQRPSLEGPGTNTQSPGTWKRREGSSPEPPGGTILPTP